MKILFVHKDLNQEINAGGINTVYLKHIEELQNTNNELFVITSREGKWNLKAKRYVVTTDKDKRSKEIEKIINEIDPDIIDVFSWGAELVDYVKKPHRAKVIMRADIPMKFYGREPQDEEMARYCDKIISISKWCDFEWSSVVGSNTTIIPHACDVSIVKRVNKIKNSVVWVGKATDTKGFDLLFKLPSEFFKKFKLTVVCAKTIYSDVKLFDELEKKGVTIAENLSDEDYFGLLNKSQYVLSTARKEGFCIAVLEAMNYGCIPVVPYWIGGTTDFVNNNNGIVYKNFDNCFEMMKNEKNPELKSQKAIDTASKYRWSKIAKKSLKVYRDLYKDEN